MTKGWLILLLFIGLSSCKDKPYDEVEAENDYSFSGIVELGTPVSGARVSAYEFADLRQGKKLQRLSADLKEALH